MTFFGFPKVKWLQHTGKVGKCIIYRSQIFSGIPTGLGEGRFLWTQCIKNINVSGEKHDRCL